MAENEIVTTHLDAAAALMVNGFSPIKIEGEDPYRFRFIFQSNAEAQRIIDEHHAGTLQVSSLDYWDSTRRIRERVAYVRRTLKAKNEQPVN